jgi:hypothetical protein
MVLESVETGDTCLFLNGVLVLVFLRFTRLQFGRGR